MKQLLRFSAFVLAFSGICAEAGTNVILVVADGMGPSYTTGYRYFADNPDTKPVETTVFDELWVGMASTYPDSGEGVITDSAAAATALSAGIKTYNGAIAMDASGKPVTTVLEMAKARGMKTGIAVTSQIVHATPAAFIAHNTSRKNYNAIADAYFDERINDDFKVDVMLGGGWRYFVRPDRNLVEEFVAAGYQYADTWQSLDSLRVGAPVLGLLADVGLPWALDMQGQPRLKSLTQTAVQHLQNPKGFFLLVEASQVDWAGHANDIAGAMAEMQDLAETLEWLRGYVDRRQDTLLVVTADHSTGGFSLGAEQQYLWRPELLRRLKSSPDVMAAQLLQQPVKLRASWLAKALGLQLNSHTVQQLEQAAEPEAVAGLIKQTIDQATHTGWTTGGHTAVDVPVLALGQGAKRFVGFQDNTDIAKQLMQIVQGEEP